MSRKSDSWRPAFHFSAKKGWINDPNGLVHYRGLYHLFYQYYPHKPEWGPMHWGHAVSSNLFSWKEMKPALLPDKAFESLGCWSGTSWVDQGQLSILYTSARKEPKPVQQVSLAESRDGKSFKKHPKNPVIAGPPPGFSDDFRDPKIWREGPLWKSLVGSSREGRGCVLLYHSADRLRWEYQGVFAESDGSQGNMWECPDFFPLGKKEVLFFSPMGLGSTKTLALIGARSKDKKKFHAESAQRLDFGPDFYAPQTLEDPRGGRVMIGWLGNWDHRETPARDSGWQGQMSLPRRLMMSGNTLVTEPVEELKSLRRKSLLAGKAVPDKREWVDIPAADTLDLEAILRVPLQGKGIFEIQLRCSEDGRRVVRVGYEAARDRVFIERMGLEKGPRDPAEGPGRRVGGKVYVRIVLDKSSVEVFAGKPSTTALTTMIFPDPIDRGVRYRATGGLQLASLKAWSLGGR